MTLFLNLSLTTAEWIQSIVAVITLMAVLVALFKDRIWLFIDRPKIRIKFSKNNKNCCRIASSLNSYEWEGNKATYPRQYYRLQIGNDGRGTAHGLRVKVNLLDKQFQQAANFDTSLLRWMNNDKLADLAPHEHNYINLISVFVDRPDIRESLRIELADLEELYGIVFFDRPPDRWIFEVSIYGDNLRKAIIKYWQYVPAEHSSNPGDLREIQINK